MGTEMDVAQGRDVRQRLRRYIEENFLPQSGLGGFADSDSFLEKGIIDSTGVLELLEFIEQEFAFSVGDDEVVPDNLDSVDNLTRYIQGKTRESVG